MIRERLLDADFRLSDAARDADEFYEQWLEREAEFRRWNARMDLLQKEGRR